MMYFYVHVWQLWTTNLKLPSGFQWVKDMAEAGANQYTFHLEATGNVMRHHSKPLQQFVQKLAKPAKVAKISQVFLRCRIYHTYPFFSCWQRSDSNFIAWLVHNKVAIPTMTFWPRPNSCLTRRELLIFDNMASKNERLVLPRFSLKSKTALLAKESRKSIVVTDEKTLIK